MAHPTRIFKTPEELEKAWIHYKSSLIDEAKRWPKISYVGKDGRKEIDYPKLPLILDGFYVFCRANYGTVKHYFENKEGYYEDFGEICSYIRDEIRADQCTGGLLGEYNASITQRLNGLKEQVQNEVKGGVSILNIDPLDDSTDNKS